MKGKIVIVGSVLAGGLLLSGQASSAGIACEAISNTVNYMEIDNASVSACLDAGTGNISGNPNGANPDEFLQGVGSNYVLASKSDGTNTFGISYTDTQSKDPDKTTGTWSFNSSFWDSNTSGAIGFKFGTGGEPDEWFVYQLVQGQTSGNYTFFNINGSGGGLSHVNLYSEVPLPAAVWLFGSALVGFAGISRKKKIR